MATAKKLPSGKWRCLIYIGTENGKRKYKSFTADTKKEAEKKAVNYQADLEDKRDTVREMIDNYIRSKENVLSQTTLRSYLSIKNNLLEDISRIPVKALTSSNVQAWIGSISSGRSPKTVKNAYGLLSAALESYAPEIKLCVKLPQAEKKRSYVPTDNEIKVLMDYLREHDKDMYIACNLAAFGTMRRSEICALTASDVSGNIISVNKAMVLSVNEEWIIKTTKNISSTRDIEMPGFIIDILPKEGRLVNISPSRVSDRFIKYLKRLNMRKFRFHDLRHYSASIMHAIGVPDVYIMERGGWSSDHTLKNIYRGSMDDFSRRFTEMTNDHFSAMQHEMQQTKKEPSIH